MWPWRADDFSPPNAKSSLHEKRPGLTFSPLSLFLQGAGGEQAGHDFTIYPAALNTQRPLRESTLPSQESLPFSRFRFLSGKEVEEDSSEYKPDAPCSRFEASPRVEPRTSVNPGV